jgi:UDP-N-acetylmuramoyl-L-alanyl-D-glutamate--2,6-diaminopimelate ligase
MRAPPEWARSLTSVGVTGTNGKTSTTTMVAALLGELSRPVARATTLGNFLDDERVEGPPHYAGFEVMMQRCSAAGGRDAALELTSEALALGFAKAWPCQVGAFTNLTLDHSDAHGSPEHYLASKAQLFMSLPPDGAAVLNAHDENAELLLDVLAPGVKVVRYGLESRGKPWASAELSAERVVLSWQGTTAQLRPSARFPELNGRIELKAIGEIFVENALAALGCALSLGVPTARALRVLAAWSPPAGRFQVVRRQPYVVVDYAHTPDALERTLSAARALCQGTLSVVFGAGGDRDRAKRPLLGAAARAADKIVLTSDNPRRESPGRIAAQIAAGLRGHSSVRCELDRARAIQLALREAEPGDVVVIAGKGHEQTQVLGDQILPLSDVAIVEQCDK